MARSKLKKFSQNEARDNVIQPGKALFEQVKGRWNELVFGKDGEITLELACGRGEYTTGLATVYPEKHFIGVDIKGDRLWYGSNVSANEGLRNTAFLRTPILDLPKFFEAGEVSEIWITFPDPRPRSRDEKRRLTHPRFLELYRSLCRSGALLHLKTDNRGLFDYSLETLTEFGAKFLAVTHDLYKEPGLMAEHHGIITRYERKFSAEGFSINYLKCIIC